jgi:hypothetical protein
MVESLAFGLTTFSLGFSRLLGCKGRVLELRSKDKAMIFIAVLILIPSFTLIAFGKNCPECFGLIGLVVGHFFGREMGKSERSDSC